MLSQSLFIVYPTSNEISCNVFTNTYHQKIFDEDGLNIGKKTMPIGKSEKKIIVGIGSFFNLLPGCWLVYDIIELYISLLYCNGSLEEDIFIFYDYNFGSLFNMGPNCKSFHDACGVVLSTISKKGVTLLFEKKYWFIVCNEDNDWNLLILVNPSLSLLKENSESFFYSFAVLVEIRQQSMLAQGFLCGLLGYGIEKNRTNLI